MNPQISFSEQITVNKKTTGRMIMWGCAFPGCMTTALKEEL